MIRVIENFLLELFRRVRNNQVAIIIDGENFSKDFISQLSNLRDKVKEIGQIRVAQVIYQNKLPDGHYDELLHAGFSEIIVPGNVELAFLLEVYDLVLENKIDFFVLGTHRDELIPLFSEIRKKHPVFSLIESYDIVSKAYIENLDGIIELDNIQEFNFKEHSFAELEQIDQYIQPMSRNGIYTNSASSNGTEEKTDIINIGPVSEELLEDDFDEIDVENS